MSSFGKISILSNYLSRYYKSVLHRTNWVLRLQSCDYTRKSAEETLGIEKPKRPLNPFFKFMIQIRPALNSKIPGISSKEAIVWSSKHWQQLDPETKLQMKKVYENDLENYKKKITTYKSSLTEEQKEDIKRVNLEMIANREKQKLKAELKKLEKPKKPMSSYLLYTQSRNEVFPIRQLKEYHEKVKVGWLRLSESERDKFDKQAQDLMKKYKKDMAAWELRMISMGHANLVRRKPQKKLKDKMLKSVKLNSM